MFLFNLLAILRDLCYSGYQKYYHVDVVYLCISGICGDYVKLDFTGCYFCFIVILSLSKLQLLLVLS